MEQSIKAKKIRKPLTRKARRTLTFFAFISPWLIGFTAFTIVPMIMSLIYSFTDVSMATVQDELSFLGFDNFIYIFTKDDDFKRAILNTFVFAGVKVLLLTVFSLLFALLLNAKIIGRKVFRVLIYLPSIIPIVSVSLLWKLLFSGEQFNVINFFLSYLGLQPVNFLSSNTAMGTIIFISIWSGLGPNMLIFLAAIQNVDTQLMEAAELDGAGPFRKFISVIVPAIKPVLFFVVLTSLIGSLQAYAEVELLTGGGPGVSTLTMSMSIVNNAFKTIGIKTLGYACAQGWIVFLLTFVLTLIYIIRQNKALKNSR